MKTVILSKSQIEEVFAAAKTQPDYITELYRLVFPNLAEIESVDGSPCCSKELWCFICDQAMAWDRKEAVATGKIGPDGQPTFMPGGAWLNWGFSSRENLTGFAVEPCHVTLKRPELAAA